MQLGTNWVEPGKGATVRQLCAAYDDGLEADGDLAWLVPGLALTGRPIQEHDRQRIVAALARVMGRRSICGVLGIN